MIIQLRSLLVMILIPSLFFGQGRNLWSDANLDQINPNDIIEYSSTIKNPVYLNMDKQTLANFLLDAPDRFEASSSSVLIQLPNATGGFDSFEVFSTQTMARELAESLPGVRSYVGINVNKKSHRVRITITPYGFYAMTTGSSSGQTFINPYARNSETYVVFSKQQVEKDPLYSMVCEFETTDDENNNLETFSASSNLITDGKLRKYRFGVASTSQYSTFHWQQAGVASTAPEPIKKNAVQAAMVVTIDRVNEIYERDFGATLEFIPNNLTLIVINPSEDPYSNDNGGAMLAQNQTRFNTLIGSANYDIGHVFSTGGGGIAALGSLCVNSFKAYGVTGLPQPVGDPFDIDFVSHEIGHQFGANHTQNNNCQRNNATAMEPGSGSTIMGYAGICAPNVQNSSDSMFHYISISSISSNYNGNGGSCAEEITIANAAPVIQNVPNYTIPRNTPFMLEATATDANGDDLTYSWEQLDNQVVTAPPVATSTSGPSFRVFSPTPNPVRYFPSMSTLLANQYSNTWEVLPVLNRSFNFGVAVRDNNPLGGQVATETTFINAIGAGPFRVTSQSETGIVWDYGETETITWNVAGTDDSSGVNAQNVDILLSINNGQSYDVVLASNVPNNGNADIVVPNIFTNNGRIMVKGSGNIFFDINNAFIGINGDGTGPSLECEDYENDTSFDIPDGVGSNQPGDTVLSSINVTEDVSIESVRVSVDINHSYIQDLVIRLIGPDDQFIDLFARDCTNQSGIQVTFDDLAGPIPNDCSNPFVGNFAPSDSNKSLNQWFETSSQGEWTLAIADFWNMDTGTLNSWSLEICTSSLGVDNQTANTFGIYPNPSDGNFVLSLSSPLNENATGKLYNIQGKLMEEVKISGNRLQQNIQLDKVSQGIYLFEVSDGSSRIVEKLIIK